MTTGAAATPTEAQHLLVGETNVMPLRVEQYQKMVEIGMLPEHASVELLDGLLVIKDRRDGEGDIMTEGRFHRAIRGLLAELIADQLDRSIAFVDQNSPFELKPFSVPEPDVYVARGTRRDYFQKLPAASDMLLVAEIAHSSLPGDRSSKFARYASAGIPNYWIVNVPASIVEAWSAPVPEKNIYTKSTVYQRDDTISLDLLPDLGLTVAAKDFLPEE
ncbi:Uma2 family endonuclease [Stratiformator vulcanicus]|uniref:Putative restriction endonuclease domain-containing protein n=1 Tax=Stratiformator vulcanicus TaxID=2527980 RepID=A0A517R6F9_9PLAN|nr:Uma2 family endonuclease [Stratiformator vulcanicus]QDT39476.1 hypothetical protein Pan189_38840 [Stratiformator vulcanicus]